MTTRPAVRLRLCAVTALTALAAAGATVQAAPSFVPDDQPIGFIAQPRSTSLDVRDGGALAFYVDYERQTWNGNLRPYPIDAQGRLDLESDLWGGGAAAVISQQHYLTGRKIVTLKADGSRIPFLYNSLDGAQKTAIGGKTDYVDYIRGSRADEGTLGLKLRVRRYVLGDIIRSRPAYVAGTVPMVYVGANDGMLHAIRADTGKEVYAYVPSMLISKLPRLMPLATATYTHAHFVDASPRTAVVTISGASKRILVGGLGAGGRGMYALDISADATAEPSTEQAAADRIMWEITNTSIIVANPKSVTASTAYANLGYTYGEPIIGRANNGNDVIFMANGYMSTTGKATLLVINPANGAKIAEIDTGSGSAASPNGLTSPTPVDKDGDGDIDYLYAGDLNGNLWKFDVTSSSPASWSVSLLYATSPTQAITVAPVVADHPRGGRIVAFGTGRVLTASDMTDASVHYMYGVWDGAPVTATTFLTQTLSAEQSYADAANGVNRRVRTLSTNAPDWTQHRGWKVAMPAGERFVGDRITLTNARVYTHSFNPTANLAGRTKNPVEPVYENWEYQFNFLSGGGATTPVFDLNTDGKFDNADLLPDAGSTPMNERIAAAMFLAPGVVSQPVVVRTTLGAQDLYAQNADLPALSVGDPGVSGGHFDADSYYPGSCSSPTGPCSGFQKRAHVHEYDDKYGVTGVNMMNASDPTLNLSKAAISVKQTLPQTPFKVLVTNQYLNPAARLRIGPSGDWLSVKDYGGQASSNTAQGLLDAAPVYTYGTVTHLVFGLPMDAFQSKDWWGTGPGVGNADIRAGLIPTKTGCVNSISDSNFASTPGPYGERHNGALTVQLIRADTPANALELNHNGGDIRFGWRVKASEYKKHVLALWTFFWHHPSGACYGESDWVKDPPQDPAGADPGTPPAGTDDPKDGYFNAIGGNSGGLLCSGDITKTVTTYNAATQTLTTVNTYSSGCIATVAETHNGNGTKTIRTTIAPKNVASQTTEITVRVLDAWRPTNTRTAATTGRISWREMIRE